MVRMISAVGVAVGHLAFSLPAAAADVAAWCAVINYGEYWDCQYRTFEECRPNALANVAGAIRARTLPVLRRSTAAPRKVAVTHSRPSDEAMSAFGDKADMTIALRMSKADITSLVSPRARPSSEGQLISVRWRIQSRGRP
jgi:hypothetical protein